MHCMKPQSMRSSLDSQLDCHNGNPPLTLSKSARWKASDVKPAAHVSHCQSLEEDRGAAHSLALTAASRNTKCSSPALGTGGQLGSRGFCDARGAIGLHRVSCRLKAQCAMHVCCGRLAGATCTCLPAATSLAVALGLAYSRWPLESKRYEQMGMYVWRTLDRSSSAYT